MFLSQTAAGSYIEEFGGLGKSKAVEELGKYLVLPSPSTALGKRTERKIIWKANFGSG